jgi:undecaprenyl-diphosphatase
LDRTDPPTGSGNVAAVVYSAPMQARDDPLESPSMGIRWAFGLWAAAVAVFTIIAVPPLRDLAQPVDDWFWDFAVETEWQPAVVAAKGLHIIGSGWVMIPFEIALGVFLFARRRLTALIFWVAAVGTSEAIVWISKAIYGRQRPPDALVSTTGNSFPSAHAATAAVVAIGLVLLLVSVSERRWYWYAAAAGWASLMAASRVYLRAHWFSDVVAGAAVGAAVVITFALLIEQWAGAREDQPNGTAEE